MTSGPSGTLSASMGAMTRSTLIAWLVADAVGSLAAEPCREHDPHRVHDRAREGQHQAGERDIGTGRDATHGEGDAERRDAQGDPGPPSLEAPRVPDREHRHERRIQVRDDRDQRHGHGRERRGERAGIADVQHTEPEEDEGASPVDRTQRAAACRGGQQQQPCHERREHEAPRQERQRGHARVVGHPREERAGAEQRGGCHDQPDPDRPGPLTRGSTVLAHRLDATTRRRSIRSPGRRSVAEACVAAPAARRACCPARAVPAGYGASMAATPSIPAVLGIDLGTTSVKAACLGLDGRLLGLGRGSYPTQSPEPGIAEQQPDDWWAATVAAVREALAACEGPGAVRLLGIAVVGQGPTTVALDGAGRALGPAITWLDTRAAEESSALSRRHRCARLAAGLAAPRAVAGAQRSGTALAGRRVPVPMGLAHGSSLG